MGYHFSSRLTATLNLCLIYFKITWALAILLEHMHNKFEINRTKIKGGCKWGRKVVTHNSKSDLPLAVRKHSNSLWSFSLKRKMILPTARTDWSPQSIFNMFNIIFLLSMLYYISLHIFSLLCWRAPKTTFKNVSFSFYTYFAWKTRHFLLSPSCWLRRVAL